MAKGDPDIDIKVGSKADTRGFADAEGWIGKLRQAFRALIGEFSAAEKAAFGLDAALRNQGLLTEDYRKRLQGLASEMQALTTIADDEWLGAIKRLTQFGVGPDRIEEVLKVTKDVAGLFEGDLSQATNAVTRALTGNFDQFKRLGVQIPETGSKLEKWKTLAEQTAEMGGGQLEAMASGTEGAMQKLSNAFSDSWEALGGALVKTGLVIPALGYLTGAVRWLGDALETTADKAKGMNNIWRREKVSLEDAAKAAEKYADQIDAINKATSSLNKQLDAEQSAAEAVKDYEDTQATARHRALLAFIDNKPMPEEKRAQLRAMAEQQFEQGQSQRDLDFKAGKAIYLERKLANENAREAAARSQMLMWEAAAQRERELDLDLRKRTLPLEKQLAELEGQEFSTIPTVGMGATGMTVSAQNNAEEIRRARAVELERRLEAIRSEHTAKFGARDDAVFGRAAAARANYEKVSEEVRGQRYELGAQAGRARLSYDSAAGEAYWGQVANAMNASVNGAEKNGKQILQLIEKGIAINMQLAQGQQELWRQTKLLEQRLDRARN